MSEVGAVVPEASARVTPGPSRIYTPTPKTTDIGEYRAIATVTVMVPLRPGSNWSLPYIVGRSGRSGLPEIGPAAGTRSTPVSTSNFGQASGRKIPGALECRPLRHRCTGHMRGTFFWRTTGSEAAIQRPAPCCPVMPFRRPAGPMLAGLSCLSPRPYDHDTVALRADGRPDPVNAAAHLNKQITLNNKGTTGGRRRRNPSCQSSTPSN